MGAVGVGAGCAKVSISATSSEMRTPFVGGEQQWQQQPIRGHAQPQQSNQLHGQRTREGLVYDVQVKSPLARASWLASASSTTWRGEEENTFIKGRHTEQEKYKNLFGSSDTNGVGTSTEKRAAAKVDKATAGKVIRLSCSGDGGSGTGDSSRSQGDDQEIPTAAEVTLGEDEIRKVVTLRRAEVSGGDAVGESRQEGTEGLLETRAEFADIFDDDGDGAWKCSDSGRVSGSSSDVDMHSPMNAQRARTIKIWDPVQQLQLFSPATSTASGKCSGTGEKTVIEPTAGTTGVEIAFPPGSASGSVSGGGGSGSGSKPQSRIPVQPGRAAWCEDGETFFLLNHEGERPVLRTRLGYKGRWGGAGEP